MIKGIPASPGIAIGKIFILENMNLEVETKKIKEHKIEQEIERFHKALKKAKKEITVLKKEASTRLSADKVEIFEAHQMFLADPELIKQIEAKIRKKYNAQSAVDKVIHSYIELFSEMENEYMKARTADINDVGQRLIRILIDKEKEEVDFTDQVIIFADDLKPSDTSKLDKEKVLAFVTRQGSKTSHSAIMARSLGIPAVVGVGSEVSFKRDEKIIVDGIEGKIFKDPDQKLLSKYKKYKLDYQKQKKRLKNYKDKKTITRDGFNIKIAGNVGNIDDVDLIINNGAEGIGLFRTEFLFMNRNSFPTEEEQFRVYKKAAEKMDGKPVIIRTLDIGGDKELSYLELEKEMNPFLGYRAIRMYFEKEEIFKPQLRAILRASNYGNIKLMFPMISSLSETRFARQVINNVQKELDEDNLKYDKDIDVGIMIEVPAAALIADKLAEEVNFFSLGTNDLIQYTVAVDRTNEKVANLYTPFHPAVLLLIKKTVQAAHSNNIEAGICGEAAANEKLVPLLLGIGMDKLSMNANSILPVREIISKWTITEAKDVANRVFNMKNSGEIEKYLTEVMK